MRAFVLIAAAALLSALSGCASIDNRQMETTLDEQTQALKRLERQNAEILTQLQAQEAAIRKLEPQTAALARQQSTVQCLVLSERAHSKCMSVHHATLDSATYLDEMQRCLKTDQQYRADPTSCQREDSKPQ